MDSNVIQGGGAFPILSMYPSNQFEINFTVNQVSEKLSIPKPTLRFWEKELADIIIPLRTIGGQRRYTSTHLTTLEKIRELRNTGKSLPEIREILGNGFEKTHPVGQLDIERLSKRIAEVVKDELENFLKEKTGSSKKGGQGDLSRDEDKMKNNGGFIL
jgi:DNA-binding transcriptional MerR regulator